MFLGQVIDALVAEGFPANPDRIRFAITRRHVPRPPLDATHRFVFGADHLEALRQYFRAKQAGKQTVTAC